MQIRINNTDITGYLAYQGVKMTRNDVDGPSAGRNLRGRMIRDRVATKIRIDCTCRPLNDRELNTLLNLLQPEYIYVSYSDPMYGERQGVQMYANNNPWEYMMQRENDSLWHNITFPLIEA